MALRFGKGGELSIVLRVRDDGTVVVKKFADETGRSMDKAKRSTDQSAVAWGKLGAAIGASALAAGTALAVMTSRALENADQIAKTADKLGLGIEALQEWRFAAGRSGVATAEFDNNVLFLTKSLGEAARGTGELRPALDALKISLRDNDGTLRSVDAILPELLDKLGKVEDVTVRNEIATKAFGRSGVSMVNLAKEGAAGMDRLRQTARDMGIVLREDVVRNAEKMNDRLEDAQKIISIQLQQALLEVAPLLVRFAGLMANAAREATDLTKRLGLLPSDLEFLVRERARVMAQFQALRAAGLRDDSLRAKILIDRINELDDKIIAANKRILEANERDEAAKKKVGAPPARPAPFFGGPRAREDEEDPAAVAAFWTRRQEEIRLETEALQMRLQQLRDHLLSKEDLIRVSAEREIEEKRRLLEKDASLEQEFNDFKLLRTLQMEEELSALARQKAQERAQIEREFADTVTSLRSAVQQQGIALLRTFAGESQTAAIAVLAVEKGLAAAETWISTLAAAQRARRELPFPANEAMAARILALGKLYVGLIAATGLFQAAQVGAGGAAPGTPANPIATQPQLPAAPAGPAVGVQRVFNLQVRGLVTAEWLRDIFAPMFNEAVEDGAIRLNVEVVR